MGVTRQQVEAVADWMEAEAVAYAKAEPFPEEQPGHRSRVVAAYHGAAAGLRNSAWFAPPSLWSRVRGWLK